jgi:hypothetical protein
MYAALSHHKYHPQLLTNTHAVHRPHLLPLLLPLASSQPKPHVRPSRPHLGPTTSFILNPHSSSAYGWHFQYLTIIGLLVSTLTYISAFIADIFDVPLLFSLKNTLSICSAPLEILISVLYWSIRAVDPELVVPKELELPLGVDLGFHLAPAVFLLVDLLAFSPPWRVGVREALGLSAGIACAYWAWIEGEFELRERCCGDAVFVWSCLVELYFPGCAFLAVELMQKKLHWARILRLHLPRLCFYLALPRTPQSPIGPHQHPHRSLPTSPPPRPHPSPPLSPQMLHNTLLTHL